MEPTKPQSGLNLSVLRPYVAQRKGLLALAGITILITVSLELLVPLLLADFIDLAVAVAPTAELLLIGRNFLVVAVGAQMLGILSVYIGTSVGWSIANDLRLDASRHVATLDLDYHTRTSAGTMIERVDGDVDAVAKMFSHFSVQVTSAMLLLAGIVVLSFREHVVAGWTVVIFMTIVGIAMYLLRSIAVSATAAERGSSAELYGFIEERLSAIEDIRANGAGAHVMRRFQAVMRRYYHRSVKAWVRRSVIWTVSIGLFSIGTLVGLAVGAYLALQGAITLGTVYLLSNYMSKLEDPIEEVTDQLQELQKAAAGLGRLQELFTMEPSIPRTGTEVLNSGALGVALDQVTFAYDEEDVLSDISFEMAPGTHLGLLGRTGSGKSTITKLLARFYDVSAGVVKIGPLDIKQVAEASLRQQVAVITQDVQLFEGSVKDNVTMFVEGFGDEAVETALRDIGLDSWLDGLTDGIHTHLNTGGKTMSSGEAQLVALARAYLLDPGLVILDEPSSRVDPATEAVLTRALDLLLKDRTAVIVAHRLDTVAKTDEIMVLDEGRIVEHGARVDLEADPDSRFSALLATAAGGVIEDQV